MRLTAPVLLLTALACSESASEAPVQNAGGQGSAGASGATGTAGQGQTTAGSAGTASGAGTSGGGAGGGGQGNSAGQTQSAGTAGTPSGGSAGAPDEDPNAPRPSTGCDASTELEGGTHELEVGDLTRQYSVRKPDGYDAAAAKPWPLVLALHPNGSAMNYWAATTGDRAIGPLLNDKAVVVMPQARNDDWRGDLPVDLAYFEALIADVESKLCIDTRRVVAMGHSGGGSFAGVLGCHRPDIRAIAASGAVIYFEEADCIGEPAAWITIGEEEAIPERIAYRDFFREAAGCATTSQPSEPDGCVLYDCPTATRPVEFCSHPGGHVWPSYGATASVAFLAQFF